MKLLLGAWICSTATFAAGTPCDQLTQMTIPKVTVRAAAITRVSPLAADPLPDFCRIQAVAHPVPDSEIEFEVWIPQQNWNGKFQGNGNGGYSGALAYTAMVQALKRGYATASHNTGHPGDNMGFGQGHPEKVIDYAHRAAHVMTENAKLFIRAHTGRYAEKAYFVGCSAGGHQAMQEAQKYPDDYDGIVAGAPANNRLRQTLGFHWSWRALHRDDGSLIVPAEKLALVTKAVVDSCDAVDGLKDGLIDDPRRCDANVNLSSILTTEEADAVRKVWAGVKSPQNGLRIFTGWPMGSEDFGAGSWRQYLVNPTEPSRSDLFRFFVFHDPNWDYRTLDYDRDLAFADKKLGFMNATDLDMSAFNRRGGKLLMYAGWADPVVPPGDTAAYYEAVSKMAGDKQTRDFFRLFMAPGMGHCGGGSGPNQFDAVGALDEWVTKGVAPDRIIARNPTRTRPLCAYPQVARYKGSGSVDDAANFDCAMR